MSRKIRVLHVAEAAGGVERYLRELFKYTQNVDNYIICSQNYSSKKIKPYVKKCFQIKMAHSFSLNQDVASIIKIKRLIRTIKPDIIYAHSSKGGALARLANLQYKVKIIYNPHGWSFNEVSTGIKGNIKNFLFKLTEKLAAPFTDQIVCISDFEKETAIKHHISSRKKLKVIYSGIDFSEFNNSKKIASFFPDNSFVVGMVARITETKAPDVFVKAAKIIHSKIPNAYFLIVGDGDQKDEIIQLIKKEHLETHFKLTGWVSNPADYMRIMHVGLLLSRWEGFGLVLPEYMYSSVPIVATNVGGIPYIVKNKKTGILISPDNPQEVADAVINLHNDLHLRSYLINNANLTVKEKFSINREAYQTEKLYYSLIYKDK